MTSQAQMLTPENVSTMTTINVADDGGDEMTLLNHNDYIYPAFRTGPGALNNLPSVKIRSDDIIICAYPKSGTHWVYEITRQLVAGKIELEKKGKMAGMIEVFDEETYKDNPSPRILDTHVLFRHLPEEVKVKKPKLVYITRNPKDTTVSYFNFISKIPFYKYTGEWKNYLKPALKGKFDYGSWFDYTIDWEEVKKTTDVPILTLHYEDLKEGMVREAKKLRDFFGLERSDEFLRQVCESCNFSSLKKTQDNADLVYRKGEVGDWKNWFTVAQNEWFDQLYQERMKDCQLQFRYSLD